MIEYNNQLINEIYDIETKRSYTKKNGNVLHKYCNNVLTFDIEVTSAWLENGKVIGYEKGKDNEYWNSLQALSLPYIWQFSFEDNIYYGRELRDFTKVLDDLPTDCNIVIWVHNLSYEFHFLSNFLTWKSVFARSPHKPMKCVPVKYPNIEFRCSYMLTRLSLDSWGKQLGVHKATGYLDYEKIRTPLTPLTDDEMYYAEQDLRVMISGIREYKKRYRTIRDIPLTQTGTVRRVVKDMLTADEEYVKQIKRLVPADSEEYQMLMDVFSGGYTHANRMYSGVPQYGNIEHYDFASSYPTVMIAEKYPMTPWVFTAYEEIPPLEYFDENAYIFVIKFTKIKCISANTYIQASKMSECDNVYYDNGRVIKADSLTMTMTEQDYITIKNNYEWESMEVEEVWESKKEYLPKKFVEYILQLYTNKTTLKNVEGMEDLYMQSKQYINSLFGMSVTAIVQPNIDFDGENWKMQQLTSGMVDKRLDALRSRYPREKRYFLSYSWGCWVTAYARRNLWKCIESCDDEVLYCDTDSIFVLGEHNFEWYNKEVTEKLRKACETQGIDFEMTRPKTPKGKPKPLGVFDKEDNCTEFITLGAKRYVERRASDNELHLTVSGINKDAVKLLNNDITSFADGFNFDKDADCVHKQLATYVTDMPPVEYPDGYLSTYTQGINLRRTGYLLSMTNDYKKLIGYAQFDLNDFDEHAINRLFSSFCAETEEE